MSDSEEDVAFESADEGEGEEHHKKSKKDAKRETKAPVNSAPTKTEASSVTDVPAEKVEPEPEAVEVTTVKDTQDAPSADGDAEPSPSPPGFDCKSPKAMEISASERTVVSPKSKPGEDEAMDTRGAGDVRSALDKLTAGSSEDSEGGSWGSWSTWGTSLLSTATESVSTFTHQVEEGLSTVMETVEAGLSVPTPEEMAYEKLADDVKEHDGDSDKEIEETAVKEPEKKEEGQVEKSEGGGWLSGWGMSGITNAVQHTVTGSLDVLETLGKKTMGALNEGDPGLKKTKSLFTGRKEDRPVLSELLREAKENAEVEAEAEKEFVESRKAHFGHLFDEYQGLAHLEALEMLSNQSETKVQTFLTTMKSQTLQELKPQLILIKEAFEIGDMDEEDDNFDDEEFVKLITDYLSNLHVQASPDKLIKAHTQIGEVLAKYSGNQQDAGTFDGKELHRDAIQALAEIASKIMEQFHKAGELILMNKEETVALYEERAKNIANLTKTFCAEIGYVSSKFTESLNTAADDSEDPDSITPLITNVYLEATNSSTYIQEAFQLLLPVIQLAAIESTVL